MKRAPHAVPFFQAHVGKQLKHRKVRMPFSSWDTRTTTKTNDMASLIDMKRRNLQKTVEKITSLNHLTRSTGCINAHATSSARREEAQPDNKCG